MKAIILCGGKGTRLGEETTNHQKCMLDVGGKPFLSYLVDKLTKARWGFESVYNTIIFALGKGGHEVIDYFNLSSVKSNNNAYYFCEEGQMAAINKGLHIVGEPAMVFNGDTLLLEYDYKVLGTVLKVEGPGLYRSAGIYYLSNQYHYHSVDYAIENSQLMHTYEGRMIEIGTPEGLQHARDHKELLVWK